MFSTTNKWRETRLDSLSLNTPIINKTTGKVQSLAVILPFTAFSPSSGTTSFSPPITDLFLINTVKEMLRRFPTEIKGLIISLLSPEDVRCLLGAFDSGELDHLFHIVTDHKDTPQFFPSRVRHSTLSSYSPKQSTAIFYLLEIENFGSINFPLFYSYFLHTSNFIVVENFSPKSDDELEEDTDTDTEGDYEKPDATEEGLVIFIRDMTDHNSHILFYHCVSLSMDLYEIPNSYRMSFDNVQSLLLTSLDESHISINDIEKLSLSLTKEHNTLGMLDFSREPKELLSIETEGSFEITNKTIAAHCVSHSNFTVLKNVSYKSKSLALDICPEVNCEPPVLESLNAPDLSKLIVISTASRECEFENLNVPSLRELFYQFKYSHRDQSSSRGTCETLVDQLPLSNLDHVVFLSPTSHCLFTPSTYGQFTKLKSLCFSFDDSHTSLLNGGYGEFPSLLKLDVRMTSMVSNTNLVPNLSAPLLESFKFEWRTTNEMQFTGATELEKTMKMYPRLSTLDITISGSYVDDNPPDLSGVFIEVSDRVENLLVSGLPLETFSNLNTTFSKLYDLQLGCSSRSTRVDVSLDAPKLSTLTMCIYSEVNGLLISDFPELETLKVIETPVLVVLLTDLPALKRALLGSVAVIMADPLPSLEMLYLLISPAFTREETLVGLIVSDRTKVKSIQLTGDELFDQFSSLKQIREFELLCADKT